MFVSRNTGASNARSSADRSRSVQRLALRQHRLGSLERRDLGRERLVALERAPLLVEALLDRAEVGEHELVLERAQVARGVVAVGGAHHEHERVGVAQRAEQPAPKPLARLGRQAREVRDLERRRHHLLRLRHRRELVEPRVGEVHDARHPVGRVLGVEAREGPEQPGVPGVGQPHESQVLHGRPG